MKFLTLFFVLCTTSLYALDEAPAGVRRVLIICGHPGDEEHHKSFAEIVDRLQQGLITNLDISPGKIDLQFGAEPMADDPACIAAANGRSTREEISENVARIRAELKADDALWVIVMGHAYFDGHRSQLNLPGPDLFADEFGKLFAGLSCREQLFLITCPVSGYFIKSLSAPERIVITATEADLEFNETECAGALADVLNHPPEFAKFDADQDGKLTLLDLYVVLVRQVIERFAKETNIVTEHAQLDDNGDGRGSEVQINFLTEEQGGRLKPDTVPAKPKKDGIYASKIPLTIRLPEVPELPAN